MGNVDKVTFVLMPGLDGSGKLFDAFLNEFPFETTDIISYPFNLEPDYDVYAEYVRDRLPENQVILIAESFSGIIANLVASRSKNVIAIVFISSFLSCPFNGLIRRLVFFGLPLLHVIPLMKFLVRGALFAKSYDVSGFAKVMKTLPRSTMIQRVRMVLSRHAWQHDCTIPTPYLALHGRKDLLIKNPIENAILINAPHGLLQCEPAKASEKIMQWLRHHNIIEHHS